jgi:hypothetical protein
MEDKQDKIVYIEVDTFVSKYKINFKNIEDFEYFIKENNIKYIFYSNQKCFLVIFDSLVYSFAYDLQEGYYKTIEDYKDGNLKKFTSCTDYYNAVKNDLKDQEEEAYYKKSLFLSVNDYKNALEYDFIGNEVEKKYSVPIIGLISKEDLKENIYYANVAFSIYLDKNFLSPNGELKINNFEDKNIDEFIKRHKGKIESLYNNKKIITEWYDYFFIYLDINMPTAYRKYEKEDAVFFYYTKFAQYDFLSEFLNSRIMSEKSFHLSNSGFYIMKNTNNILKEMNKNKYDNFFGNKEFEILTSVCL